MKEERILNALGQINEEFIEDAAPAKEKAPKPGRVRRWIPAACLVLLLTGALYAAGIPGGRRTPGLPDDTPSAPQSADLMKFIPKGLSAEVVENPLMITEPGMPYIPREAAVKTLAQASAVLDCTVEEICRLKVAEPGSDRTWYFTCMTLSVNSVLHGSCEEKTFRTVNVSILNSPYPAAAFLSYPDLENCREQRQAAFTLEKRNPEEVWKIGDAEIAAGELGEYFVSACMEFDGTVLHYLNYDIPLTELN